jgi:hypothetical protein
MLTSRPRAARRPHLRADLPALPGGPFGVRRRVRAGLVQAHPPRHGPGQPLPRPARPQRVADLAGPGPGRDRTAAQRPRTSGCSRRASWASGLSVSQLVATAWASASTFRRTDKRGGANGARVRLEPQRTGRSTARPISRQVLRRWRASRHGSTSASRPGATVSLADLIVLAGCAAIEHAAKRCGLRRAVPFTPGRTDATGADRRRVLRRARADVPTASATTCERTTRLSAEHLMVERANLLGLTAPEMTVLVGGLRALDANTAKSHGRVLTDRPGTLTNDFFVNLLDMGTSGPPRRSRRTTFEGRDRVTGHGSLDGEQGRPRVRVATRSCGRSRRSTRLTTRRPSSSATSWRRGTR